MLVQWYNSPYYTVYPHYPIGRNFCLEGNDTISQGVIIHCTLNEKTFPLPNFYMSMTRVSRNGTVEGLLNDSALSEQATNLSLHPSLLGSLFEEDTDYLRITCNVSNSFGSNHKTTDVRLCGV